MWVDLFAAANAAAVATAPGAYLREAPGATWESLAAAEARLQRVLLEHRIFLSSGAIFGTEEPGWFRIVFGYKRGYLEEGLKRIVVAIKAFGENMAIEEVQVGL